MITTATGAKKVESTDNWREIFDAHNDSVDAEDKLAQDTAPIVNGNKSTTGAAAGEYVLVRNSSITGITDGAYKAAQAIPANTVIDSTYLTAITGGIANDLNSKITVKELTGWTKGGQVTDASKLHMFVLNEKVLLIVGQFTTNQTGTGNQTIFTLPSGMSFSSIDRQDVALGVVDCYALSGWTYLCSSSALSAGTKYIRNAYMLLA